MAPRGMATRPTSDQVREAIFNVLFSLGGVEGDTVLDLFAGSGAMGIEALSRGAAHATFVDHHRDAVAAIRANVAAAGVAGQATIVQADASTYRPTGPVDTAFADPPYAFAGWDDLLAGLDAGLVVAESDRELAAPEGWEVLKVKRYGTTVVTLMSRSRNRP